jgi:hybrid cluster-associated redox disulfide protein
MWVQWVDMSDFAMEAYPMQAIQKDTPIAEVVEKHPETIKVFLKHGLMCFGCAIAQFENIEQGASAHGINLGALLRDLNAAVASANS